MIDSAVQALGWLLRKIPDGNERVEAEAQVRAILVAHTGKWGPAGIAGLISATSLNIYCLAMALDDLFEVFVPLDFYVIGVMILLTGAFFNFEILDWLKYIKELKKAR